MAGFIKKLYHRIFGNREKRSKITAYSDARPKAVIPRGSLLSANYPSLENRMHDNTYRDIANLCLQMHRKAKNANEDLSAEGYLSAYHALNHNQQQERIYK